MSTESSNQVFSLYKLLYWLLALAFLRSAIKSVLMINRGEGDSQVLVLKALELSHIEIASISSVIFIALVLGYKKVFKASSEH